MAAKSDMIDFSESIDIEVLIAEGIAKRNQIVSEAENQADLLVADLSGPEQKDKDGLDMTVKAVDMFKF